MKTLRLILGDQLNQQHSWFQNLSDQHLYLMMEIRQETDYTVHHIQKVVGFFAAMRNFAAEMQQKGHQFLYFTLDDPNNSHSLADNLFQIIDQKKIEKFEYQLPDEYRLDQQLFEICQSLGLEWQAYDTEHFFTTRDELANFFKGKKTYLMESFYRQMRKKHDVLMEGDQPLTGQWNYDKENRKSFPKRLEIPLRNQRTNQVVDLEQMIKATKVKTIGTIDSQGFLWPTTRLEALADLRIFCERFLVNFGNYQDAMSVDQPFGYHSLLSFAINIKLLSPKEVIEAVIAHWQKDQKHIPFSAVEGFVRQIIGWREYMRGIYWAKMPAYSELNELNHGRNLPRWYWDGNTRMNCLHHAIRQSLDHAYAHHIQRLMITGNFALLNLTDPDEVDKWYLGIYIDAIEWVEITNTRGMSQFADGGIVGTKPYVSSSNYIKKMSNYCDRCYYDQKKKTGERACPFNSLYWNFYDHHRKLLERNPRIGMMYRTWDKMSSSSKTEMLEQAQKYLEHVDQL